MNVNQIYTIVNSAAAQAYGTKTVEKMALNNLVSIGDYVLSSETSKDNFLNTLVDIIAEQVADVRAYTPLDLSLYRNNFEYGAVLQRIYTETKDAQLNNSWDLVDGQTYSPFDISKTESKQKLFSVLDTWEIEFTIPDIQIKSAFQNAQNMASFIDSIFTQMQNSMALQIERMDFMCLQNFIGEKIVNQQTNANRGVRHLLTEYNTIKSTTLTPSQAIVDMDFLKYSITEIKKDIKRLERVGVLYNNDGYKRFTSSADNRILLHTDYIESVGAYLQADTYHKELVDLPKYSEVTFWQGSGTSFDLEQSTRIDITTSSNNEVEQSYIIGLMSDFEAMGTTIDNRRTTSIYNPKSETTNYWLKADIGYFNDMSHNGVVYIME